MGANINKEQPDSDMVGQVVECPIDQGVFVVGEVVAHHAKSQRITIKDEDGQLWRGYEYQACTL